VSLGLPRSAPAEKAWSPLPCENRDQHLGIILHGAEYLDDLLGKLHVPGVPLLRAVDGHSGQCDRVSHKISVSYDIEKSPFF